jgi:magnesium transporter
MSISVETARSDCSGVAGAAPDQAVRHYVVTNVPTAELTQSVAACRALMSAQSFEDAAYVFVLDDRHHLAGIVKIGQVLAAPAERTLSDLIRRPAARLSGLRPTVRTPPAAPSARGGRRLRSAMRRGALLGAVSASALMSILRDEHMEDLDHMAGILGKSEAAKAP